MVFIDISLLVLKTLWEGRVARSDLKNDLYTSAGDTVLASFMTLFFTIPHKHHVTVSSHSSKSSPHRFKPPSTQWRLFVAESFKPINLPKLVGKSIGKFNVKSMLVRHRERGHFSLKKYVSQCYYICVLTCVAESIV